MWRLLQLADGGFPTGGFAHSAGLEAANSLGEVADVDRFVRDAVWQAAHAALPFVRRAWAAPAEIAHVDAEADAFLLGHVANRASRAQGRAFVATCASAFGEPAIGKLDDDVRAGSLHGHLAPMQGAVGAALGLSREQTLAFALFACARGVTSAAIRLGRMGPLEAQGVLATLPFDAALRAVPDQPMQTAPIAELCGQLHDLLYSRLFQS
jgi:urease accessory protein